jgi:uncharacterized protein (TIGR02145 family)
MMKKVFYLALTLIVLSAAGVNAQVTIGGLDDPKVGAILDLNSTTKGGLLFSNISLPNLGQIPAEGFTGITAVQETNTDLTGTVVYNTNPDTGIGLYVWDGEGWKPLTAGSGSVQPNPGDAETYPTAGTYKLSGRNCLDVYQTDYASGSTCMPKSSRTNDFAGGYSFTYTFAGSGYTDLTYAYADGSSIVSSVTGNGTTTCTLTFQSSALGTATGKDKANALKVTLYAIFKVDGALYKESLEISIQDCVCGCPAKIDGGQWLTFMCRNLGGVDIPFGTTEITPAMHGDWYKFGAKEASLVQAGNDGYNNATQWTAKQYENSTDIWSSGNNPCPAGWRLPSKAEWLQVINSANNAQNNIGTYNSNVNNYTFGKKFGDFLILPSIGYRSSTDGSLWNRGAIGQYWSNEAYNSGNAWSLNFGSGVPSMVGTINSKMYGFAVRCVAQ